LVQPKYSIISVGANNSYGHPTAGTLNRLKKGIVDRIEVDVAVVEMDDENDQYSIV
jgi:beta-lactamase superfamily II metal-dependent hydrolase